MGQKKLIRFAELKTFPNVLQYPENMKGNWHLFFNNQNPIILELACGKGEYAVGLGRMYSQKNFIGIDIKGNRIWRGAKTALQEGLKNVAFLRTQIEKVVDYFDANEISEIWITFPDPQPRLSKIKKRLTHPRFLRLYQKFLHQDGLVHLKTDSPDLYNFTKAVISLYGLDLLVDYEDVYNQQNPRSELLIRTYYESLDIAKSNRVHYLQFRINKKLAEGKDETLKNLFIEELS
jgi:tRNA (guanine-N7-)-methyltransferase